MGTDSEKQALCDVHYARLMDEHQTEASFQFAVSGFYKDLSNGLLDEHHGLYLEEVIRARRERFHAAANKRSHVGKIVTRLLKTPAARTPKAPALPKPHRPRIERSPEQQAASFSLIRNRRRIQKRSSIPAEIAEDFTYGEQCVLGIIALQYCARGVCSLTVAQIARRAKVCERLVKRAVAKAKNNGLISIRARIHMPNIVTVVCPKWLDWFRTGRSSSESKKSLVEEIYKDPPMGAHAYTHDPVSAPEPIESEIVDADEDAPEAPPKLVAPVTPTSIGHGPKPVAPPPPPAEVMDVFLTNVRAEVEGKAAETSFGPVPTKPVPRPAPTAMDTFLAKVRAEVEATAKQRAPESSPEPLDEWELPEVPPEAAGFVRRFMRVWPGVVEISQRHYPRCFDQMSDTAWLSPAFETWLKATFGWGKYEIATWRASRNSPRRFFIGHRIPQEGLILRLEWGGAKLTGR